MVNVAEYRRDVQLALIGTIEPVRKFDVESGGPIQREKRGCERSAGFGVQ